MGLPGLHPFPFGDAEGMRARAFELRSLANEVQAISHDVEAARGSLQFEGPAGDRIRNRIHSARSAPASAAQQLYETAAYLTTEADRLEQVQAAWRSLKARLEAEAEDILR